MGNKNNQALNKHASQPANSLNPTPDTAGLAAPVKDLAFCPTCHHLREEHKDWKNPSFLLVYAALEAADRSTDNDDLLHWLNDNGFANLTCCPHCHVDDFTHVEGCGFAALLALLAKAAKEKPTGGASVC